MTFNAKAETEFFDAVKLLDETETVENLNAEIDDDTEAGKTETVFDSPKFLNHEELIVSYLNSLLSEGNAEEFLLALNKFLKLKGMTRFASEKGLAAENGINPKVTLESVSEILDKLGLRLVFNGQPL